MTLAAKCTCGKSPWYCVGGEGCRWHKSEPVDMPPIPTPSAKERAEQLYPIGYQPPGNFTIGANLRAAYIKGREEAKGIVVSFAKWTSDEGWVTFGGSVAPDVWVNDDTSKKQMLTNELFDYWYTNIYKPK